MCLSRTVPLPGAVHYGNLNIEPVKGVRGEGP